MLGGFRVFDKRIQHCTCKSGILHPTRPTSGNTGRFSALIAPRRLAKSQARHAQAFVSDVSKQFYPVNAVHSVVYCQLPGASILVSNSSA